MGAAIEYTHNKITLTVTGWAEYLKVKRSAMANRISRWKNGYITKDKCFSNDLEQINLGKWGGLSNTVRKDALDDIPEPTDLDRHLQSPDQELVRQ